MPRQKSSNSATDRKRPKQAYRSGLEQLQQLLVGDFCKDDNELHGIEWFDEMMR